jgi:hypothetical protein
VKETNDEPKETESFSATGIDNALDLLEVVNAKTDKASVGQQAAGIEKHPEVSMGVAVYMVFPRLMPLLSYSHSEGSR